MNAGPPAHVKVSSKGLIMLSPHCAHTVLSVSWLRTVVEGGGIWVSQNLITERGTSWGPAEENEARYQRSRGTFWLYIQASYVC